MIAAILLAQWRSMRSFRRGGVSLSTAASWISGLLFYGFWTAGAVGAAAYFAGSNNDASLTAVLSAALLLVLLYWQIMPVLTASMGSSLDLKKLLVYPIPPGRLFVVELLLRVTVCLEMPIVLAGTAAGLISNQQTGSSSRALPIVATLLLYAALNLLLGAALRQAIERQLRRKHVRELMMFLLLAVTLLPQILLIDSLRPSWARIQAVPAAPFLPWGAAARLVTGSELLVPLFALASSLALAYLWARRRFVQSLVFEGDGDYLSQESPHRREWLYRWPIKLFPDPLAAIVEQELRSLLRTPQFRFVFFSGPLFGVFVFLPRLLNSGGRPNPFLDHNLLALSCLYSALLLGNVTYFNCFGFERSAVQAWYSFPVPLRTTVIAKNVAAGCLIAAEICLVLLVNMAFRLRATLETMAEAVPVTMISAIYLIALGNIVSVRLPAPLRSQRASHLSGQGGGRKARNTLILGAFPILQLPVGLAYWARSVLQNDLVFWALLLLAAALGAVVYVVSLDSAARNAFSRREDVVAVLSSGDGPVSDS